MNKPLKALVLTGWGQIPDGVDAVMPAGVQITNFDYHPMEGREQVMSRLKSLPEQPDIVIGWSLGGKLAAYAISQQFLKPKLFVMMGSSFQSVPGSGLDKATGGKPYSFHETYKGSPQTARDKLAGVMLSGDSNAGQVSQVLKQDTQHDGDWLRWIAGARFDFHDIDFSHMPRTLIIHGQNDALVDKEHAMLFKSRIPNARLELVQGCGHLPHLHNPSYVSQLISEELRLLKLAPEQAAPAVAKSVPAPAVPTQNVVIPAQNGVSQPKPAQKGWLSFLGL